MNTFNSISDLLSDVKFKYMISSESQSLLKHKLYVMCLEVKMKSAGVNAAMRYDFKIPEKDVLSLYEVLDVNSEEVCELFNRYWPGSVHGGACIDQYYAILLIITHVALVNDDPEMVHHAIFLIMIKVWHIVKQNVLGEVDAAIMDMAIQNKLTNLNLIRKYRRPYEMFLEHYIPEIITRYGKGLKVNPDRRLNLLLIKVFNNLSQLFGESCKRCNVTGRMISKDGIVKAYYEMRGELMQFVEI